MDLDGRVDAIGMGGFDLYLVAEGRKYAIRDAAKMKRIVKKTPVVDGSGLKNTLEREVVRYIIEEAKLPLSEKKVLLVSAVDRFGLAQSLHLAGCEIIFGDLIFGLNIPIPIRSFNTFNILAKILLPVVTKLPFSILYPTGSKQEEEPKQKYTKYYQEADVIAGDFLFIRRYLPAELEGRWILTNTTTAEDVDYLQKRKIEYLITTTPVFNGRSFGTNVMEATLLSMLGKDWDEVKPQDYLRLLKKLGFKPRIEKLN